MMQAMHTHCPSCRRFCGPANTCPYCDAGIPMPPLYRRVRTGAWLLATAGLLLIITAARNQPPQTVPINEITPAMQFAGLHFEGALTSNPRISRNHRSASANLDDGSGSTLRLVFLDQAALAIRDSTPPLREGCRIRVHGSLRIQPDQPPVLFIRSDDQFRRVKEHP